MCLVINNNLRKPDVLIAQNDIPVKKIVKRSRTDGKVYSLFMDAELADSMDSISKKSIEADYPVKFRKIPGGYSVTHGIHAYLAEHAFTMPLEHAVIGSARLQYSSDYEIISLRGYIPKGTRYAANMIGECVADLMIMY